MRQVWIGHSMSVSTIACMRALKATLYFSFVVVPSIRKSGIKQKKKSKKDLHLDFPFPVYQHQEQVKISTIYLLI